MRFQVKTNDIVILYIALVASTYLLSLNCPVPKYKMVHGICKKFLHQGNSRRNTKRQTVDQAIFYSLVCVFLFVYSTLILYSLRELAYDHVHHFNISIPGHDIATSSENIVTNIHCVLYKVKFIVHSRATQVKNIVTNIHCV